MEARRPVRCELDGQREPVLVRPERARLVGELVRKHRRDEARDVHGVPALLGAAVERRARRDEVGHVRDVHPDADAVAFAANRDRVVEVLRRVGVDRERRQLAEIGSALQARLWHVVRLEALAEALVDHERLEHVFDPLRRAEHPADARAAAALGDVDQVARPSLAQPFAVDRDRRPRHEVRLADDELAALGELDDQTRRKRRMVMDGAGRAEQEPERQHEHRRVLEGDRVHVLARVEPADRRRQHELLAEEEEHDRRAPPRVTRSAGPRP